MEIDQRDFVKAHEERSKEVDSRETPGHWEMDTVVSKKKRQSGACPVYHGTHDAMPPPEGDGLWESVQRETMGNNSMDK